MRFVGSISFLVQVLAQTMFGVSFGFPLENGGVGRKGKGQGKGDGKGKGEGGTKRGKGLRSDRPRHNDQTSIEHLSKIYRKHIEHLS